MEVVGSVIDHFDTTSAVTVFWDTVPVLLKRSDREDAIEELSVRLLSGHARHNHSLKVLRIHIFNNEDLFFLHTLEVSEDDFQTLKVEQGILVDFANFSGKIIDLLRRCIASKEDDTPRFRAVLVVSPAESVFKMVETNDFKQLAHISLCFRPGNDMAIKSFLAFRLTEVQKEREGLRSQLENCSDQLNDANQEVCSRRAALEKVETQYNRMLMEAEARAKDASANMLQERVKEREELLANFERTQQMTAEKHSKSLANLQRRVDELDGENRSLREQKYSLDAKVSELSHKYASSEGHAKSLQTELQRLQAQVQTLSREKTDAEVQLTDTRGRLTSATDKVGMQENLIQQQAERLSELDQSIKRLEARCTELRDASSGHEHRAAEAAAEITKGNHIIERLTADLQTNKEKLKRKQAIIVRQEEELTGRDKAIEAADRETGDLKRQLSKMQEDQAQMQQTNEELRTKLEDSKEQLKGNEQMIRWLNSQVNEAQMAATRPSVTSRYSTFRPTSVTSASMDTPSLTYARTHMPGTTASRSITNGAPATTPFKPSNAQALSHGGRDSAENRHPSKFSGFSASQPPVTPSFGRAFGSQ